MPKREWLSAIPEEDLEIYQLAGFGNDVGRGSRPAVLVIDVQYRTVGDRPAPIRDAIKTMYPTACGEVGWRAVGQIARLIEAARRSGVPVIYPYVAPKRAADAGVFGSINPKITTIRDHGYDFVEEVKPGPEEVTIPKRHASAFFGTALASYLIDFGIDTLLITGATTSGCVRATAADAFSFNFKTSVVADCVFDRIQISHAVSLFDMDAKYADVIDIETALRYLEHVGEDRVVP